MTTARCSPRYTKASCVTMMMMFFFLTAHAQQQELDAAPIESDISPAEDDVSPGHLLLLLGQNFVRCFLKIFFTRNTVRT